MQAIEQQLGEILLRRKMTIATAESCTGGRLAALMNKWPGSSEWYKGSVIAYSNDVKQRLLSVPSETLQTVGAVSEETVLQMVKGVQALVRTDCAIATSGIAGPGGGTPQKPVGTVWIAWAIAGEASARCYHFNGTREEITAQACQIALEEMVRLLTLKENML